MKNFKIFTLVILSYIITMTSCSTAETEDDVLYKELSTSNNSTMESNVLGLVNEYRASNGLISLKFANVAYSFAKEHNEYMIAEGRISHDNFDLRASNLAVKAKADFVAENLAMDFTTAEGVVHAWINSPIHKKVMEGDYTHSAIHIKANAEGKLFFTQMFYK
ncbi:CAP domain-containing protein [Cellulophaga sp. F20128]|uniref:CAP domain-containing protein n=1 Tax=Cellulophaga sp. F20128 TaxID=2926413 RepID=UPI001FF2BFC0|nr:CAP domain-containing protein [Cellulophaga sp. F20128]MCK0157151.1 CAP domain-containing protein [Cellulophaga sp. F20128]